MRQQINENPVIQAVFVGLLLLVCVFMLYTRVLSGGSSGEEAPATPTTSSDTATESPAPATPAAPAAPAAGDPAVAPTAEAPPAAVPGSDAGVPAKLEAGKGMPEAVVDAYEAGDAVVILIVRHAGIDDKRVKAYVEILEADSGTTVFVTGARNVARYSQVANGVGVNRVPALIVMQPRSVSDVPTASVSYGFRSPQSVVQAVRDARYEGKKLPYYPE
jgi:hypothetical protein